MSFGGHQWGFTGTNAEAGWKLPHPNVVAIVGICRSQVDDLKIKFNLEEDFTN